MKVTREQLIEVLAAGAPEGAVWVYNEDKTTSIVNSPSVEDLERLRSLTEWPMYLIRVDLAENYMKQHGGGEEGIDGAVKVLNLTFSIIPEPDSKIVRAAAITGRFLNRRRRQE